MGCHHSHMLNMNVEGRLTRQEITDLIKSRRYQEAQVAADLLFKDRDYRNAALIYQKIIEGNIDKDYGLLGLGNCQQLLGVTSFDNLHEFYETSLKEANVSKNPYDSLSLCLAALNSSEQESFGLQWYEEQIHSVENYQIYLGYANMLHNCHRFNQSLNIYKRAIDLRPNLVSTYVSVALIRQFYRKDNELTPKSLSDLLTIDPQNVYGKIIKAKNAKMDKRLEELTQLQRQHPQNVRIINEVGIYLANNKKHTDAIQKFKNCIGILPEFPMAHFNLAYCLCALGKLEEGLESYLSAIQQDKYFIEAYRKLASLLQQLNLTDEIISAFPTHHSKLDLFQFYYHLGVAYYEEDIIQKSIKYFQKALKIKQHPKVYNSLGITSNHITSAKKGTLNYAKCLKIDPNFSLAYYNLAIYYRKIKIEYSIEYYKKALQIDSNFFEASNNIGNIYRQKSDNTNALKYYKKAIEVNSSSALVYNNYMVCEETRKSSKFAFLAFSKTKDLLTLEGNQLNEKSKTYIKKNIEKCGEKWKNARSSLSQLASSAPTFSHKQNLMFNQDDFPYLHIRRTICPSIIVERRRN